MFEEVSRSDELWIVSSFTPWCLRCSDYMSYLEAMARDFLDEVPVHFGALNCYVNRQFCGRLGLMGHPMVGLVYGGWCFASSLVSPWHIARTSQTSHCIALESVSTPGKDANVSSTIADFLRQRPAAEWRPERRLAEGSAEATGTCTLCWWVWWSCG